MHPLLPAFLLMVSTLLHAEDELLPPPALPDIDTLEEAEELQPEVTIRQQGDATIEEYRDGNGRIYMVKITPARGYPYYLIDTDGDGRLDTRRNELDPPKVNQWILFRW